MGLAVAALVVTVVLLAVCIPSVRQRLAVLIPLSAEQPDRRDSKSDAADGELQVEEHDTLAESTLAQQEQVLSQLQAQLEAQPQAAVALELLRKIEQAKATQADAKAASAAFAAGGEAYMNRDFDAAATQWEQARDKLATPDVCHNLARAYTRLERYPEALAAVDEAQRLTAVHGLLANPDLAGVRGVVYSQLERYTEALMAYAEDDRLSLEQGLPVDWRLFYNRGRIYRKLKRYDDALAEFAADAQARKELGLAADPDVDYERAICLCHKNHLAEALRALKSAEQLRQRQGLPEDPDISVWRGSIYDAQGRAADALVAYKKAERICQELGLPEAPELTRHREEASRRATNKIPDPWQ